MPGSPAMGTWAWLLFPKTECSPKNYNIYRYPNTQEGALIWFHDHTLGATRLNVYCRTGGRVPDR